MASIIATMEGYAFPFDLGTSVFARKGSPGQTAACLGALQVLALPQTLTLLLSAKRWQAMDAVTGSVAPLRPTGTVVTVHWVFLTPGGAAPSRHVAGWHSEMGSASIIATTKIACTTDLTAASRRSASELPLGGVINGDAC